MPVSHGPYHLIEDSHMERVIVHISATTRSALCITTPQTATHELFSKGQAQSSRKATTALSTENPVAAVRESPINNFFASFPSFRYDPTIIPSKSYQLLQKLHKWDLHSSEGKAIRKRYQDALRQEFDLWYGSEDGLEAWHALCRAIGTRPLPTSCELSEKVSSP